MKFKRLLAGAMTFVFSLSMIHVGVSAEEIAEKVADEKEKITVVLKREDADESLIKTAGSTVLSVVKTLFSVASFPIKELLRGALIFTGAAGAAIGICFGGFYIVTEINNRVKHGAVNPFKFVVDEINDFKKSAGIKASIFS